ncbi:putative Transducin/WD40 repeat-like superfamily protein [Hibiscus syriacus]|uniref:Transducin/WD40 repeat-like superfamily protein n=1 Tax=Hibiscus syriacus TaxID=106335 RepID=A0A6A2XEJ2_HIBSY|nr:putative Transducin/WD40 repeat-like superfamily protein [Hibiscus syriacus]
MVVGVTEEQLTGQWQRDSGDDDRCLGWRLVARFRRGGGGGGRGTDREGRRSIGRGRGGRAGGGRGGRGAWHHQQEQQGRGSNQGWSRGQVVPSPSAVQQGHAPMVSGRGEGTSSGGQRPWGGRSFDQVVSTPSHGSSSTSSPAGHDPGDVAPAMESQTISKPALPSSSSSEIILPLKRPDNGGKNGIRNLMLLVNHFGVIFDAKKIILHYDVDVKPIVASKLPTREFEVQLFESSSYLVTLKLVNELGISQLNDSIGGQVPSVPRDILQAMDLALKETPKRFMFSLTHSSRYPGDDLGRGIVASSDVEGSETDDAELQPKYSLKLTSQGLALCLDYSVMPVRKPLPVIDYLKQQIDGFNINEFGNLKKKIEKALNGLDVYKSHLDFDRRHKIYGLSSNGAQDISFVLKDQEINLVDYFKVTYGMDIKHQAIPCLELGKRNGSHVVPLELCVIAEGQRCPKDLLDKQMQMVLVVENCGKFGMKASKNMTIVAGRVLSPPELFVRAHRGADVNHPVKNSTSPSIAAVVASMNWPVPHRYAARICPQEPRSERFRLTEMFDMVLNEESVVQRAFKAKDYFPTITLIVAQKRHHTRFFPMNEQHGDSSRNVPPGTVIDSAVVDPSGFHFHLFSHCGMIGTSKSTQYHVLWDEHGFTSDHINSLYIARASLLLGAPTVRSKFFDEVFKKGSESNGKPSCNLSELLPYGKIRLEAFQILLSHLYTGKLKPSPMERRLLYSLRSLCRRYHPILVVAFHCQCSQLVSQCVDRVARSDLESICIEKELPYEVAESIRLLRLKSPSDAEENDAVVDPLREKRIRRILRALDSDDFELVKLLLTESDITLDDAAALHYAADNVTPRGVCFNVDVGWTSAVNICRSLTRPKDYHAKSEQGKETNKDRICIDVLEREMRQNPMAGDVSVAPIHWLKICTLEFLARLLFPSEAKLAIDIAHAETTSVLANALPSKSSNGNLRQVDLNETTIMQRKRLLARMGSLMKTVEMGRRYFPHCSEVLDKFMEDDLPDFFYFKTGTPEEQTIERTRFRELKEDVKKAFNKDKAEFNCNSSSSSSSTSLIDGGPYKNVKL